MTDRDRRPERAPEGSTADPFRLNLEQQKKRAKDLLKALNTGDPDARERFHRNHPQAQRQSGRTEGPYRLADAQLVIAREIGVSSWPALRSHIAQMGQSRDAMARNTPLDSDATTLHIRCGSDMKEALEIAGLTGDFLEYSNPFCQGPVVAGAEFIPRRAQFLAYAAGREMGLAEAEFREGLEAEEAALAAAATNYERVVLWFEHDSYDQLILARCLAHFADFGAPKRLELISVDGFPGAMRFIGIGQLPPEALRMLWPKRSPISRTQLELGVRVWQALQTPDPTELFEACRTCEGDLPHMGGAIVRHLQELPSTFNGTALTEHLSLECLADGSKAMGRVFRDLMLEKEPLPWLGDLMFYFVLKEMLRADEPPIAIDPASVDEEWPRQRIFLTEAGRGVLAGQRDYLSLNPPERWVGGVRIVAGTENWRWDPKSGRPVRQ